MQAQQTRTVTKSISQTQSLAAIQTLLKAGLGAITFLRSLLPEDNFTRSHFTSINDSSPSGSSDFSPSQDDPSQDNDGSTRHVTGFRIMTMTRGYTDEADRLLNYLEYGIFDALEKQYLKSFIFAIYLDNKDPNNIVEAYTFNFKYHTLPDSNISLPIMTLGDDTQKMTLRRKKGASNDPVTRAIESGRTPTLKDVKQSVKALLKTLIHAMNHMDVLPRRRFATFKVFYTDQTPADYEPPHFQAGDFERDKWFFMTHDLDEVPDRNNVGKVDTGHHSVNLSITSIASYLPSSTELDHTTFTGTTSHPVVHTTRTPVQEALACKQQVEKQTEDAEIRNVVWSSEDCLELEDPDADGDDDPDYIRPSDAHCQTVESISLVGVREKDGRITAVPDVQEADEAQFGGFSENVPTRLDQIVAQSPANMELEETQSLPQTPRKTTGEQDLVEHRQLIQSLVKAKNDPWATSSTVNPPLKPPSSFLTSPPPAFDPEMLKNMHIDLPDNPDIEMLSLETQIVNPASETADSIESFESQVIMTGPTRQERPPPLIDNGLDCECGVSADDESCFCEGGCGNWFHVWCMGYHAVNDPRMPPQFICFACRARKDIMWELIKLKLYPQMLGNFKELALFRRAIKVAEQEVTFSLAEFTVALGGDSAQARAMVKRLEKEEFISEEGRVLDDLGLQTRTKNVKGKTKGKQPKPRKNIQRIRYVFNHVIKLKTQYLDYFRPDNQSTESRLIRLSELKKALRVAVNLHQEETQTQEETQGISEPLAESLDTPATGSKRSGPENDVTAIVRPEKKMKISLAVGIDLAE